MKLTISLTILLTCLHIATKDAFCSEHEQTYVSEICHIDHNYVLLYKVVNWWNDSLPEDDNLLCGDRIKCQSIGGTQTEYNESQRILKIQVDGDFGLLISIFKQCDQCFGPSSLQSSWLNEKYFGNGEAASVPETETAIHSLVFNKITKKQAFRIRTIEENLTFVLEGQIGGLLLLDGKIALHQTGDFLKSCPKIIQSQEGSFPVSLKIVNSQTEEVIAIYTAVYEH